MGDTTRPGDVERARRQTHVIVTIYGGETVWIGDIVGDDPATALVSVGFLDVTFRGTLTDVRDRLQVAVRLLDEAADRPRRAGRGHTRFATPTPAPCPALSPTVRRHAGRHGIVRP